MLRGRVHGRVEVILNLNARGLRGPSLLAARLTRAAADAGALVHATHSLEELDRAAAAMASRGVEIVVLAGGDGSCTAGLSALARSFPPERMPRIALAPAGTVGTIAKNIGVRGWHVAERVLPAIAAGRTREATWPTLRIEDDAGGDRLGFIFGTGLVAHFFEVYDASPTKGLGPAAAVAARVFFGSFVGDAYARRILSLVPCVLTVDGEQASANALSLVVASVLRDVGLHFRVTYRAREDVGRFHLVASGLPAGKLGPQMPRVLMGRPLRGEPHIDVLATQATLAFTSNETTYIVDGELLRARQVRIGMGRRVTFLLPSGSDG